MAKDELKQGNQVLRASVRDLPASKLALPRGLVSVVSYQGDALPPPVNVSSLPRQICALDIETAKTTFKNPEACEIACVGVLIYKRAGFAWRRGKYRWFGVEQLAELSVFLHEFPGIIVGHNVFDFDYRALQPHIALDGVVEKTIDLYMLLQSVDRARRARLKLESLAWINLKRRKLYNSRTLPALWRAGQRRKVLAHNKRDCELTAELWMYLLRRREVYTKVAFGRLDGGFHYPLTPEALSHLAGHMPQLTYAGWLKRIGEWGNAVRPPNYNAKTYVEEPDAGRRPLFLRLFCQNCKRAFILVARRSRWFRKNETIVCPFCKDSVPLEGASTLMWGYSATATAAREGSCIFVGSRQPIRFPASAIPDPKSARAWIDRLRIWDW